MGSPAQGPLGIEPECQFLLLFIHSHLLHASKRTSVQRGAAIQTELKDFPGNFAEELSFLHAVGLHKVRLFRVFL